MKHGSSNQSCDRGSGIQSESIYPNLSSKKQNNAKYGCYYCCCCLGGFVCLFLNTVVMIPWDWSFFLVCICKKYISVCVSLILQFWVLDSCVFTLGVCVGFIIIIVTRFSFAILWPFYNHCWVFRSFHFSVLVWKFLVPAWIFISSPSSTWLYSAVPHSHFSAHFSFFCIYNPSFKKVGALCKM